MSLSYIPQRQSSTLPYTQSPASSDAGSSCDSFVDFDDQKGPHTMEKPAFVEDAVESQRISAMRWSSSTGVVSKRRRMSLLALLALIIGLTIAIGLVAILPPLIVRRQHALNSATNQLVAAENNSVASATTSATPTVTPESPESTDSTAILIPIVTSSPSSRVATSSSYFASPISTAIVNATATAILLATLTSTQTSTATQTSVSTVIVYQTVVEMKVVSLTSVLTDYSTRPVVVATSTTNVAAKLSPTSLPSSPSAYSYAPSWTVTPASSPSASAVAATTPDSVGPSFTGGMATYFYQNNTAGNCGTVASDSDFVVAVDTRMYNNGANCGRRVKITRPSTGQSSIATIRDSCPTCVSATSLDLSVALFNTLGTANEGTFPIVWEFIS